MANYTNKLSAGILITLIISSFVSGQVPVKHVIYGDHNVTFLNVTGPENGVCTWQYYVCSGTSPAISHWILESCVGTTNDINNLDWGTSPPLGGKIEYGTDPKTNITGLKFDVSMDDSMCATFWFRVKECSITSQEAGIKAGNDIYTNSFIKGPAHDMQVPEYPSGMVPFVALFAAIGIAALLAIKR